MHGELQNRSHTLAGELCYCNQEIEGAIHLNSDWRLSEQDPRLWVESDPLSGSLGGCPLVLPVTTRRPGHTNAHLFRHVTR